MSLPIHPVLESAECVSQCSEHVKILHNHVPLAAKTLMESRKSSSFDLANWKVHELNPKEANEAAIDWIFVVDTLNFSFWTGGEEGTEGRREKFEIEWRGQKYSGYWALCAALNRALDENIPICDPHFLANSLSLSTVCHIFRTGKEKDEKGEAVSIVPMLEERFKMLKEVGENLIEWHRVQREGSKEKEEDVDLDEKVSFANIVRSSHHSASRLLQIILDVFPCYCDEIDWIHPVSNEKRRLKFWKRAQILVADIWACFEGSGLGQFDDIDHAITMFADYRVPQMLCHLGVLEYSPDLMQHLVQQNLVERGSQYEIEIRANSLWVVELIRREMEKLVKEGGEEEEEGKGPINSIVIDFFLWDSAKAKDSELRNIPIHRTITYFY